MEQEKKMFLYQLSPQKLQTFSINNFQLWINLDML